MAAETEGTVISMRDGEMVAAIVAGDPAALGDAYDHYAPALYAYCRSLLAEPSAAADAVYDTFIVAAAKLYGLRDPSLAVAVRGGPERVPPAAPYPSRGQPVR